MNNNTRLELDDTGMTMAIKMAGGNHGALRVILAIMKDGNWIDPVGMGGVGAILMLDTFGIYGSRIWMLFKDVCGEDIIKMMALLRACQLGMIPESSLQGAIDHTTTLDTDYLLMQVRERLEGFGKKCGSLVEAEKSAD